MVNIAYGCCVGSWDRFNENVRRDDRACFAISGNESITKAYNRILSAVRKTTTDLLVLQHDDLKIIDPIAEDKFIDVFKNDNIAIVGCAGGGIASGLAWWNDNPIGHQLTNSGLVDFGTRTGFVDNIEGSFYVFNRWAIETLSFDEQFEGFNGGYDEISLQLRFYDKAAYVADIDTHHKSSLGFATQKKQLDWYAADALFRKKWNLP